MTARLAHLEPVVLFVLLYAAALLGLALVWPGSDAGAFHYAGLLAVTVATWLPAMRDSGLRRDLARHWRLRFALSGAALGSGVIAAAAALLALSATSDHDPGIGFPYEWVAALILPAALHEELLFRGIGFSALRRIGDGLTLAVTSAIFALLHAGNASVSTIALLNIFFGGWLLGLVRIRWGLLAAVAMHVAWNVTSGPLLGFRVSGWRVPETVLEVDTYAPVWWTGGTFGLEGGLAMTVVLLSTVAIFERTRWRVGRDTMHPLLRGVVAPGNPEETELT